MAVKDETRRLNIHIPKSLSTAIGTFLGRQSKDGKVHGDQRRLVIVAVTQYLYVQGDISDETLLEVIEDVDKFWTIVDIREKLDKLAKDK